MPDIRTPSFYFEDRNRKRQKLQELKMKLDDVVAHLQELKQTPGKTKAHQTIVKNELKRVKEKQKRQRGQQVSRDIVDKIMDGDGVSAVEMMKEELDARVFLRIEPDLDRAGKEMQEHIFND